MRFSDKHRREFQRQACRDVRLHRMREPEFLEWRLPADFAGMVAGVLGRCSGPCREQAYVTAAISLREIVQVRDTLALQLDRMGNAKRILREHFEYRPAITSRRGRPLGYLVGVERWLAMTDQQRDFHEAMEIVEEPYASAEPRLLRVALGDWGDR
jgi:hypothetical protein